MNVNELVINVLHTYYFRQNILAFLTRVPEYEKKYGKKWHDTNLLLKFGQFYFKRKEIMDWKNLKYIMFWIFSVPFSAYRIFFFARYKSGNFKNKISFILYPNFILTLAQRTITYLLKCNYHKFWKVSFCFIVS